MAAMKIRNAATLITCCKVAPSVSKSVVNYKVMLLKRGSNMKVASSNYVFPGGAFDKSDESLNWLSIFQEQEFSSLIFKNVNRPILFKHENYDLSKQLPPEVSFRLCAIRETFEETGLLLAHRKQQHGGITGKGKQFASYILDKDLVAKWRARIHGNSAEFINMFLDANLVPDIFGLHEWSCWLTPVQEKAHFDTLFFTCFLKDKPNIGCFDINLDESQKLEFYEPKEALKSYEEDKIVFMPPQNYELSRLSRFNLIEELAEYSLNRQAKGGVRTWQPKFANIKGQNLGILPGDDYYNLINKNENPVINENDELHLKKALNINRFTRNKIEDKTTTTTRIKFKIESNMLFSEKH